MKYTSNGRSSKIYSEVGVTLGETSDVKTQSKLLYSK